MKSAIQIVCVAVIVAALGAVVSAQPIFVESFGSQGTGDGQFRELMDVAVDSSGNVYVVEDRNCRIQKFTVSGGILSHEWTFGTEGSGDGQFNSPAGIAVDSSDNVYVTSSYRIQKFSQSGGTPSYEWSYGTYGSGDGEFKSPKGIAVDSAGDVYVADSGNDRVQRFSESGGTLVRKWSFHSDWDPDSALAFPYGVAVDSDGNVYVADAGNDCIEKITQNFDPPYNVHWEWVLGSEGSSDGQFESGPYGVGVDFAGNLYVSDGSTGMVNRIQKFTRSGATLSHQWTFGSKGSGDGQFNQPKGMAVDSAGNLYVASTAVNRIVRLFDVDALSPGQTATFANLRAWSDANLGNSLAVDSGKSIEVIGTTTIESGATLVLRGGTIATTNLAVAGAFDFQSGTLDFRGGTLGLPGDRMVIPDFGVLRGFGAIQASITGQTASTILADGNFTLGNPALYDGFGYEGTLSVGAHTVTVHSKRASSLGILTELEGGTLRAPNGIALGIGRNLAGWGNVDAKVSAGFGSTIEATGPLSLGDAGAYDGFFSDGSLITGANSVTINDRNVAVLGSLTQLGDGVDGGVLTAGNADPADRHAHFLLEQGKNMVGRGSVNGNYMNYGDVIGDGTAAAERLVFNAPWVVSGKGAFTNTLILGTFSPGESPGITTGENQGFGGTVQVELGGTNPGFGAGNHDQINDSGEILLFNSPALDILPWNDFIPEIGDEFVILTWQGSLDGAFGDVIVDPWFTDLGLDFDLHYNNVGGAGNLTIEATPEPATLILMAAGLPVLLTRKRKSRCTSGLGGLTVLRRRKRGICK